MTTSSSPALIVPVDHGGDGGLVVLVMMTRFRVLADSADHGPAGVAPLLVLVVLQVEYHAVLQVVYLVPRGARYYISGKPLAPD